jgi:hypothetical protein
MRGTPTAEGNPPGMAVVQDEFGCRISRRLGSGRFLEAENPKQDSSRIKEGVFMRAVECQASVRPRDEMAAGSAIDFARLFVRNVVFDERVFGILEHGAV